MCLKKQIFPIGRTALIKPGVAVFEPKGYDPAPHTPSPIFHTEPEVQGPLPEDWKIKPVFFLRYTKRAVFVSTGSADLYGGGEVRGKLRRNNDHQIMWNTENPAGFLKKGKVLYQSHPWVMGVRKDGKAFGIIADTTWKTELYTVGGVWFLSDGPAFRVVIIQKDSPEEVLKALAELSGKMALPPLWALGYQQCRYSYFPQERAAEIADRLRKDRIPCDVIWLDIHYMDQYKIFTFNPEGFSKPEELNEHLHRNNFKSVYMIDPGVKAEKGYFVDDQGREGDYFVKTKHGDFFEGRVWPGICHFPDFTNPDTCKWWAGLYKDFMAKGIDGVWNDMNEPSVFSGFGGTIPGNCQHKGGGKLQPGPHKRYHNVYGYTMIRATLQGVMAANPDKRPFVLSRSNFLGGQRYAAMWTGDNFSDYSQMKESVPMCLNIGLSGQPFNGPDIGGFMRDCTADLLRHWTSSGVYFPFARNHAMNGTANQEPWAFDPETEDICRTSIERRYRLLPYYYTLFEEASRNGLPVMRPLYWADFKDRRLRAEQQAFMVGSDLIVVPRWSHKPVLPEGEWKLFSFEDRDDGFQAYLAIRPGAAIPICDVMQSTVEYNNSDVTVLVNPDAEGRAAGTLYSDAGEGYGYKEGEYARYSIQADCAKGKVSVKLSKTEGKMDCAKRLRIAVIKDGRLEYSEWTDGLEASFKASPSAQTLNSAKLDYVYVTDYAVAKELTKIDLIMSSLFKAPK